MKCDKSFARHLLISAKIAYVAGDIDGAHRYINTLEKTFAPSTVERYKRDYIQFVLNRKIEQKEATS